MATRAIPPEQTNPLTARKAWKALQAHWKKVQREHLRTLFAKDPQRGKRLTAEGVGLFLEELESKTESKLQHDSSTNNLIRHYCKFKGTMQ